MKKWYDAISGAAIGLLMGAMLLIYFNPAQAVIPLPGTNGPSLGDTNANVFTLTQAVTLNNQMAVTTYTTVSTTNTQAGCTILSNNPMHYLNVTLSATGSICLQPAFSGREVFIFNNTSQTVNIYGSATPFTVGTQDTINAVAGTTAYTGLTSGKNTQCFTPANGVWACASGS